MPQYTAALCIYVNELTYVYNTEDNARHSTTRRRAARTYTATQRNTTVLMTVLQEAGPGLCLYFVCEVYRSLPSMGSACMS